MKLRFLALCLLLCLCLAGCGIVQIPPNATTAAETTSIPPYQDGTAEPADRTAAIAARQARALATLEPYNFQNELFVIATVSPSRYLGATGETDVVSATAYARNAVLKNNYGAIVSTKNYADYASLFADARKAALSGLYLADLYAIPYSEVGTYVAHGLLASVYSLPYLDTNAFYFHGEVTRQSALGADAWALCTAAELTPADYPAVFFQSSVTDYLKQDPYAAFAQNNWTWDTFLSLAKDATAAGFTGFAYAQGTSLSLSLADLTLRTAATHPVTTQQGETPQLDYGARNTTRILQLVQDVGALFHPTATVSCDLFAQGGVLFQFDTLGSLKQFDTLSTGYGVLPIPKYSTTQGSYTTMPTENLQVLVLPTTARDLANTGRFLQYYGAVSYGRYHLAETEDWLRNHLREANALSAIDYILTSTVRADFSDCFGSLAYTEGVKAGYEQLAGALKDGTDTLLDEVANGTCSPAHGAARLEAANTALQEILSKFFPFV